MLFNEPKLLKFSTNAGLRALRSTVSVLFNEPKLLKFFVCCQARKVSSCFSALQRAEIAEMHYINVRDLCIRRFSALQRAEIAEINGMR